MNEIEHAIAQTKQWAMQTILHVLTAGIDSGRQASMDEIKQCQARAEGIVNQLSAQVAAAAKPDGPPGIAFGQFVRSVLDWIVDNYKKS